MVFNELNKTLERVQLNRGKDIPLEDNDSLWFLLIYKNGDWDACSIKDNGLIDELKRSDLKNVFVVWHGQWRTNLFLIDKKELSKRLKKVK